MIMCLAGGLVLDLLDLKDLLPGGALSLGDCERHGLLVDTVAVILLAD